MCRMMIAVGSTKLGPLIEGLKEMAKDIHKDGWGVAYLENGSWKVVKSVRPCFDDPEIDKLADITTSLAVLHARRASIGSLSLENTHPFQHSKWVFCHNGTINSPDKLELLPQFVPKGQTDSERLFYFILSSMKEGHEMQSVDERISKIAGYRAVNFILASPDKAFVSIKFSQEPEYFTMQIGRKRGLLVFASEQVDSLRLQWAPMENNDLAEIDVATRKCTITSTGKL